jgi:hypothetical protein
MGAARENPTLAPTTDTTESRSHTRVGITTRAVIIGFIVIIPGVFWGVYGDVVSQTDLTSISLMMPPMLILSALLVVNVALRRLKPVWVLAQSELITIYAMLAVSVVLSGMGLLQFLCTTLGAVPYYATPQNGWMSYLNYVPDAVVPKLSSIAGFYKGNTPIPWSAWGMPIVLWSGFFLCMLFCMLCINTIFRKQWMDRERLSFPIVQLPLEMTEPGTSFFANRLMWLGFLIALVLESINSLNFLFPNVPYVQLRAFNVMQTVTDPTWKAMGGLQTTFYPLAIGLGFVLAADVSFSCWFFYLLAKLERVMAFSLGWVAGPGALSSPPYLAHQGSGAFIGITIVAIYLARHHIRDVFQKAVRRKSDVDDSEEPMGYDTALIGLALGFLGMIVFCRYVGMSPIVAVVYLGLYLVFSTTIARLRAEAGPAWTMGPSISAMDSVVQSIGPSKLGAQNLVALAYFNWFSLEMRCCPMPSQIENMKMAQVSHIRQRAMTLVMILAIVVGVAVGFWACLAVWYKFGAGTAMVEPWRTGSGRRPFERISNYMLSPTKPDTSGMMAMGFGALMTFFLSFMRSKFIWFPFHPAGYVLANTGTLDWLWCPFFIAWLCKTTITRYAGIKGYRTALPFFLGLVFGDYITSSLWALAGSLLGIKMYRCFPC